MQPLLVSTSAIELAAETVKMIMKIDDMYVLFFINLDSLASVSVKCVLCVKTAQGKLKSIVNGMNGNHRC